MKIFVCSFYLLIDIHQFIFCFASSVCWNPAVQFSIRHLKSNLSISGHQTNSKCQWWISLRDAWQSGILLMYQTPLIFILCDLRWRVCCYCPIVCREAGLQRGWRQGPDETPSGRTPHPANSHPSGSGCSPLISSHQRVPAHQPPWVGCSSMSPSPNYWQKEVRAVRSSVTQPPADPWAAMLNVLWKFNLGMFVILQQIWLEILSSNTQHPSHSCGLV